MWLLDRNRSLACGAVLSLAALSLPSAVKANEPPLGGLPPGAAGVFEVRDVGAEICLRHTFAPGAIAAEMPPGYRLATLSERTRVPWVGELLRQRPELADYAHGSFCLLESGVHTVDGAALYPGRRSRVAFLWADVVPMGPQPADARFRGDVHRAQMFWLYDEEGVDRELALRVTPNAQFGRITMERSGDVWLLGIQSEDGALEARVRATSARKPLDYPMPGYETVPLTGSARSHFYVVTFAGHHEQLAAGDWTASGSAAWASTFAGATSRDVGSFIQDGFAARLALYRSGRP